MPVQAQTAPETDVFTMSIRGISGGTVTLARTEANGGYAVTAKIAPSGLIRRIRNFSYRGSANGRLSGGVFAPDRYEERADTGRRQSEVVLVYADGVPEVARYVSDREAAPDTPAPETQGGTLDPLTAIHALLRDRSLAEGCAMRVVIFDGRRRSHIILEPAASDDGTTRCTGEYRRLQGFTAREVSRHLAFPIQIVLDPLGADMLRVRQVSFQSLYGTAALNRR